MKVIIDKNGFLIIERNGHEVPQICPRASNYTIYCSHNCPLFGEIVIIDGYVGSYSCHEVFEICEKKWDTRRNRTKIIDKRQMK